MSLIFNGTTITAVIYNGTTLTTLVNNGTTVFTSGTSMGCFYGGLVGSTYSNQCIRITASGTQTGGTTNLGTSRIYLGGAGIGTTGVYYGGYYWDGSTGYYYNTVTRINTSGTQIGSQTNIGTIRYHSAGAGVSTTAIFYSGYRTDTSAVTNLCSRVNSSGTVIGSQTAVGTSRCWLDGGGIANTTGVFWGGGTDGVTEVSTCTRINTSGTIIGSQTSVYGGRYHNAGTGVGSTAIFYTMATGVQDGYVVAYTNYSTCVRINTSGTLIGSATSLGTARRAGAGSDANSSTALFYGGYTTAQVNTATRINTSGTIIGSQTAVGSARNYHGGAGI